MVDISQLQTIDRPSGPRHGTWLTRWKEVAADIPLKLRRRTTREAYRAEIDGLRFVAIAIVVIGHLVQRSTRFFPAAKQAVDDNTLATFISHPGLGVRLFFTISGFIIATQLIQAKQRLMTPSFLGSYFGRRILRIEPPYLMLLLTTWFLLEMTGYRPDMTTYFNAEPSSLNASLLGSMFYAHDLIWGSFPRLFPPGWSLEIEVQFYLLAPVLCWAFFKIEAGVTRGLFAAAIIAGSILASAMLHGRIGPLNIDYSILRFFDYFFLGLVLAAGSNWMVRKVQAGPALAASCLGWAGLLLYLPLSDTVEAGLPAILTRCAEIGAITAMFVSALTPGSSFRAFCQRPWICMIGGACYSIYLVHLQLLQVMTSVIAKIFPTPTLALLLSLAIVEIALVLIASLIFYAVVERFFMIKDWPSRSWAALTNRPARPVVRPVKSGAN